MSLEGTGLTLQQLLDSPLIQNTVTIEDQNVTSTDSTVEPLNSNYTSISVIGKSFMRELVTFLYTTLYSTYSYY